MSVRERVDELDQYHFYNAATVAAESLALTGCAYVDLEPGDATRYQITIVRSAAGRFYVATSFGPLYEWAPWRLDAGYVTEKWVADRREWTGRVLARFLNALADAIGVEAGT